MVRIVLLNYFLPRSQRIAPTPVWEIKNLSAFGPFTESPSYTKIYAGNFCKPTADSDSEPDNFNIALAGMLTSHRANPLPAYNIKGRLIQPAEYHVDLCARKLVGKLETVIPKHKVRRYKQKPMQPTNKAQDIRSTRQSQGKVECPETIGTIPKSVCVLVAVPTSKAVFSYQSDVQGSVLVAVPTSKAVF
ncbi:hypothetical protein C8R44DRAFT_729212 [Mycena epipterygia]|nr:hypothetical protein C8R44DRAFT_729212 [Mycena epipterygia]